MTENPATAPIALVVDDDAMIQFDAECILQDAGFRTMGAYNGDKALVLMEQYAGDIVLLFTDVEMPGSVTGFELATIVADRWPGIGILVASGHRKPNDGDLPERATFVEKPFAADVIHDRLHQILPDGKKPEPLKQKQPSS